MYQYCVCEEPFVWLLQQVHISHVQLDNAMCVKFSTNGINIEWRILKMYLVKELMILVKE